MGIVVLIAVIVALPFLLKYLGGPGAAIWAMWGSILIATAVLIGKVQYHVDIGPEIRFISWAITGVLWLAALVMWLFNKGTEWPAMAFLVVGSLYILGTVILYY